MISYGRQNINAEDIKAVKQVLESDWLTQGPDIADFEQRVAAYCEARYAVAVSNATAALHIACLAAGLKKGDMLWTSPNTFVASANCGRYCGADVDFVDIDDNTYNMSVTELEKKLQSSNVQPQIVIPVHFAGQSCDMEKLHELAQRYGFTIIEDASHAIGAIYQGNKVGCCKYAAMTVFSFHPVKIITTGEGGMIVTNDKQLYDKLLLYRSHGITRDPEYMVNEPEGSWYYEQIDLGFNYRMTDLQAALGVSQLGRIDTFVTRRRYLAKRYDELLKDLPFKLPLQNENTISSWHIYVVRMDFTRIKISKQELLTKMRERGIALNLHYIPVHLQPYYQNLGFEKGNFPRSESYYQEVITLPLYYDLTDDQQASIVDHLRKILRK